MKSLLTGNFINLGIQIKDLIMNISQDVRLPFFIIVFLFILLYVKLWATKLMEASPSSLLPCARGSFTVFPNYIKTTISMATAVSHKATRWKEMDHQTGQMYTFRTKRLWHGWLGQCVLWVTLLWESRALQYGWNCKVSAQEGLPNTDL